MEILIIPFLFAIATAVAAAVMASNRRYADEWRSAAKRLGLTFRPPALFARPRISGTDGDLTISVDVSSSSSRSTGSMKTRYRVQYPDLGIGLHMTRKTGLGKMAAMFGSGDVTVDDPDFEEALMVKTSDPDRLTALLTPATRRLVLALVNDYRRVKIGDAQITFERGGIDKQAAALVTTTQRLVEAARALQGEAPVRDKLRPAPAPPAATPPGPIVPQPIPLDVPAGPSDVRPANRITPPQPTLRPPATGLPTALPGQPEAGPQAATVAGDLFGRRELSFQIARRFEQVYLGHSIAWKGTIRPEPGPVGPGNRRITLLVATVPHELFGTVEMEVAAVIPAHPGLDPGREVLLSGTLSAVDAMSRRLFVENARLV